VIQLKESIGNFKGDNLYLTVASYQNNKRIYVGVDTEEESYADLTINLTDLMIPDEDYIFVNGDMTRDLRNFLEEKGIISEPIETYQYNMGKYDMVQVDFDLLKQYDSDGFKDFEKTKSKDMEI
jgi:hypothetical protein